MESIVIKEKIDYTFFTFWGLLNSFSLILRRCVSVSEWSHSIWRVHSIQLKFGMYIIGHRQKNSIDFGECKMHNFFAGAQKSILTQHGLWSQILKSVLGSRQLIRLSSNLISYYRWRSHVSIYSSSAEEQKSILMHYGLWSQNIKNIPASDWCIRLCSNVICIL